MHSSTALQKAEPMKFPLISLLFAALLLLLTGCASTEESYRAALARAAPAMTQLAAPGDRYLFFTVGSGNNEPGIADALEQGARAYEMIPGLTGHGGGGGKAVVYLYADHRMYMEVAGSLGFSEKTRAFYSPIPPPAIHAFIGGAVEGEALSSLLHEGMHHFIDRRCRTVFPCGEGGRFDRLGIPLWLNEGLAACMESARLVNGNLVAAPDRGRLTQLQDMVCNGRTFSLASILSRHYGGVFTSDDYAVAWGVAYDLLTNNPGALKVYIGRMLDLPVAEREQICSLIDKGRNADLRWEELLARRSLSVFVEAVAGNDSKGLERWERDWRQRMLGLE